MTSKEALDRLKFIADKELNTGSKSYKDLQEFWNYKEPLKVITDLVERDTPPTAKQVCKALSEQLKTPIKIGKNKHGITFNYVNKGKTLISLNYDLVNIGVQLPPHLIVLIGRFYQNNYGNFVETLEEAK